MITDIEKLDELGKTIDFCNTAMETNYDNITELNKEIEKVKEVINEFNSKRMKAIIESRKYKHNYNCQVCFRYWDFISMRVELLNQDITEFPEYLEIIRESENEKLRIHHEYKDDLLGLAYHTGTIEAIDNHSIHPCYMRDY